MRLAVAVLWFASAAAGAELRLAVNQFEGPQVGFGSLPSRFDLRRFNNALIDDGAVPLSVLERRIDERIARERG